MEGQVIRDASQVMSFIWPIVIGLLFYLLKQKDKKIEDTSKAIEALHLEIEKRFVEYVPISRLDRLEDKLEASLKEVHDQLLSIATALGKLHARRCSD